MKSTVVQAKIEHRNVEDRIVSAIVILKSALGTISRLARSHAGME